MKAARHATKRSRRRGSNVPNRLAELPGVTRGQLFASWKAQLATLTKNAPAGDDWIHEIKFDGFRMGCRIERGRAQFFSRNGQNWTDRIGSLAEAAAALPAKHAFLDGEVVALKPDGTSDFQLLQNAFRGSRQKLYYCVFDLLHLDGYHLSDVPLESRKQILAELIGPEKRAAAIRYSEHVVGNGPDFHRQVCRMGLEGIISKLRAGPYLPGRSYDWLKVKCLQAAEFVIGGYTNPTGSRTGFGALLLGVHEAAGRLVYAGKVGTGFDKRTLHELWQRLRQIEQPSSPFVDLRKPAGPARGAHWVKPELVAQIAFSNWTNDGKLRHPSYQGLRTDKPARDVVRERPVPVEQAVEHSRKHAQEHATSSTADSVENMPRQKKSKKHNSRDQFADVRLTSPDKVMYREQGYTKLDLAKYYFQVADWMLPHVAGRPLVLVRCPEGYDKECFYQKHPMAGSPKNLRQIDVREKTTMEKYHVVDDAGGLISLVQIGALEIHAWGSRADSIERPDRLVFDLDPDPTVSWTRVVESAHQIRDFLQAIGLESFVKTTGGKGLHLVVPIQRRHEWDEAKEFCKMVADVIVRTDPHRYTSNMLKAARVQKIYIDYLRNSRGATAITAYSTRARAGATVSTPLHWDELNANVTPDQFTIETVPKRLASLKRDPWHGIESVRQSLSASVKRKLKG